MAPSIERKMCTAPDGVEIVYSAAGAGEPALVFIHGGLANRQFWDGELRRFADGYRVLAPDLPGHGESGYKRAKWGLPQFGADIAALVEAEHLQQVILFGNSLGGPVAVEAALLLGDKALGIVGVDTFHTLTHHMSEEEAQKRAEAFRDDYAGSLHHMVLQLFHADADPGLLRDAERRMAHTPPEAACAMFLSLAGYRADESARRLTCPLRAINGDLYPTDIAGVRAVKPDFAAKILEHTGHYPMLERPAAFDRAVAAVVEELSHHGVIVSGG
ncbi:MAG TPA: alpha/beta hydrolase [Acidobacteriaceae bacterium]|nr:alpha/beta hydrolase [Acidobacteriaceae bacterium]